MNHEDAPKDCRDPELGRLLAGHELGLLTPEERRRFDEHVYACDACFAELYAMDPATKILRHARPALRAAPGRRRWLAVAAVAAAAIVVSVVSVVSVVVVRVSREPDEFRPRGGDAQAAILVRGPHGTVDRPELLDWMPVPGARGYDLRLRSASGELIWSGRVDEPPACLDEGTRRRLSPGWGFEWEVVATTEDGTTWTSDITRFTVRR